jgi:glycosyltransferase involved in cell wall biosynthesis
MIITMMSVLGDEPTGGVMLVWGFAGAMAARGHEVHVMHTDWLGPAIAGLDEAPWFDFDPRVHHHFSRAEGEPDIPGSEFHILLAGRPKVDRGLPLVWVQGWGAFPPWFERAVISSPFPKLCVSRYLHSVALTVGARPHQAVHIPQAIRDECFEAARPIEGRPPRLAMLYHPAELKGGAVGLEVARRARQQVPGLEIVMYGVLPRPDEIPEWVDYHHKPDPSVLVDDIYSGSRVFLNPSQTEGFGLTGVEAMACGCAVVTTDCGGPRDYVEPEVTGLVAPVDDVDALTAHVVRLLRDEPTRVELARRGRELASSYRWERSALELERFLLAYQADPDHFRQPEEIAQPDERWGDPHSVPRLPVGESG